MKYADIIHYRWQNYQEDHEPVHSTAFVVGMSPREPQMALIIALSDSHFTMSMRVNIVAKAAAAYEPCTSQCPFNPEYEGVNS